MSEILADSKYSPASKPLPGSMSITMQADAFLAIVGGRRVSFSRKPQPRHVSPTTNEPEPAEPQGYPRPPPPPTFAAEHGLPIEPQIEHRGAYAVPPNGRGAPSTSPKTSFMHLHKSELGHR
ncbi:hypothetical protein RhiTH_002158 [Rhizoctonia solani]